MYWETLKLIVCGHSVLIDFSLPFLSFLFHNLLHLECRQTKTMNRETKIRALNDINEKELELGISGDSKKSWHQVYKDSAWIYVGGLSYELNEGDILAVFSQYGEIMNVNIVRDYKTLKSKGFAYICYKDQRSTNLAVDNFNGIKLVGRNLQVDHCKEFKPPKYKESVPPEILAIWEAGCAPKPINISKGMVNVYISRSMHVHFQTRSNAMSNVKRRSETMRWLKQTRSSQCTRLTKWRRPRRSWRRRSSDSRSVKSENSNEHAGLRLRLKSEARWTTRAVGTRIRRSWSTIASSRTTTSTAQATVSTSTRSAKTCPLDRLTTSDPISTRPTGETSSCLR